MLSYQPILWLILVMYWHISFDAVSWAMEQSHGWLPKFQLLNPKKWVISNHTEPYPRTNGVYNINMAWMVLIGNCGPIYRLEISTSEFIFLLNKALIMACNFDKLVTTAWCQNHVFNEAAAFTHYFWQRQSCLPSDTHDRSTEETDFICITYLKHGAGGLKPCFMCPNI